MTNTLFPSSRVRGGATPRRSKGQAQVREWWPVTPCSIVLALDPSISVCGWAVLKKDANRVVSRIASGLYRPRAHDDLTRYNVLFDSVLADAKNWKCTDAVIELPNRGKAWKNMSTDDVRANARAIGAIEAACHAVGLTVNLVRVHEWKGRTKKEDTARVVKHFLGYEPADVKDSHNECDALGLGLWLCERVAR